MPLSDVQVEHIADLARLNLTTAEKALFQIQLSAILDYATTLQAVDTSAIPPTATVLSLRNIIREDVPSASLEREDVLANAPDATAGCFRVRAILGTETLETGQR